MRKSKVVAVMLLLTLLFVGCGNQADDVQTSDEKVANSQLNDSQISEEQQVDSVPVDETLMTDEQLEKIEAANKDFKLNTGEVLDLTNLSATIVYAEVYNMMTTPENYMGTTVKMRGQCNIYKDPNTGKVYYTCFVKDAAKCCAQGIEFTLDESKYSTEDYPEDGDEIVVEGTFSTYLEGKNRYMNLENSTLE